MIGGSSKLALPLLVILNLCDDSSMSFACSLIMACLSVVCMALSFCSEMGLDKSVLACCCMIWAMISSASSCSATGRIVSK